MADNIFTYGGRIPTYSGGNRIPYFIKETSGFPNWKTNDLDGDIYLSALSAFQVGKTMTLTETSISGGSSTYAGSILAENGKIYSVPYAATTVLVTDPSDNSTYTFGSVVSSAAKWIGGCLAPNGKIYCVPHSATQVLVINPSDDSISLIGPGLGAGNKWWGGVLAPNGIIYCAPRDTNTILKIDPSTDTITTITGLPAGSDKWGGGTLAKNGKIYFAPLTRSKILEFNPSTETFTEVGPTLGTLLKHTFAITVGDKIYFPSGFAVSSVLRIFNTLDNTIEAITMAGAYYGGAMSVDGNIYCFPLAATDQMSKIDTTTNDITTFGTTGIRYFGGILANNGKVYGTRFDGNPRCYGDTISPLLEDNMILSRYYNKY